MLGLLTPAAAPADTGACSPAKVKYNASLFANSPTTSTSFVNIPDASISFTQGGTKASCVVVRFSAESHVQGADSVVVRAYLDKTTSAIPAEIIYSSGDGFNTNAHAFEYIFPDVAPGHHVVNMQYKSLNGTSVNIYYRTTVVQFAP